MLISPARIGRGFTAFFADIINNIEENAKNKVFNAHNH